MCQIRTPFRAAACSSRSRAALAVLAIGCFFAVSSPARGQEPAGILPLDELSPAFLGMYRKVMRIEDEIRRHAAQYGVDFDLARAVCLYESGGNANLSSGPGARGYFQVMPATYRSLGVQSNIEGGIKYLAQMIRQFEREDRAVAAYNGGPGRLSRGGAMPMETLQYVIGVGQYRMALKLHDASIRHHASELALVTVGPGDDWQRLAARLNLPEWQLRLHNPFLATARLRPGQLIAHPIAARTDLFVATGDSAAYRMRVGDNYLILALTLGITPDDIRGANGLWHIEAVPTGASLRIPLAADRRQLVRAALGLPTTAPPADDDAPAEIEPLPAPLPSRDVVGGAAAPAPAARRSATMQTHRVTRGDTLASLARRYDTTIAAIQQANRMGRRSTIRVGERLRIPTTDVVNAVQ